MPKLIEPGIGPVDFARESNALFCRQCGSMPTYEQWKAKIRFELRNRSTDMGLAHAERFRCPRHSTVAHDGTKQVDMGWIHDA
nr:hypothetical protein [Burkholderia sp. Bp8963]